VIAASNEIVVRPAKVWIVDDSPLEAELVRRSLLPVCEAELFTDAAAMLEHASRAQAPDAIILDWEMPGISGIEVCQFLRTQAATRSVPILMLTIHSETRDLVQGLAAGADDFLPKPYNAAELSARVTALVRANRSRERADEAEGTVRALLMQLPEAVVSVDPDGRIVFVNLEAQRMLASVVRDSGTLKGRPLRELVEGLAVARVDRTADQAIALPDVQVGDRTYAPVQRSYAGIDERQTTFSFRDVTSERRHEAERTRLLAREREARLEAEAANRAKDDFLAIVSHELRTPLNAMVGWLQLLRGSALPAERRGHALETVERNALAQKKLVEDLLDISRIVSGNLRLASSTIDVTSCVGVAIDAIRPAADAKELKLDVTLDPGLAQIEGDPDRFQQMVWNLLSNAVKFTPKGGRVHVGVARRDEEVVVRVTDSGQGIEPHFLPHIFERFRQADTGTTRQHGGLGLGLAIVKHLAELHGGTIEATSAGRGHGARFSLRLPAPAPDAARLTPITKAIGSTPRLALLQGTACLVVEDDADARELVATVLRQRGATVTTAASAAEAIREVERARPDVVVCDIGLPTDDGYAVARTLRAHAACVAGTRLIALTAFVSTDDRERALEAGFHGFVPKPVDPRELVDAIAQLTADGNAT
jgi:signal transduction histidine kinase/DNA-binding NarL/FixJ family response regulator